MYYSVYISVDSPMDHYMYIHIAESGIKKRIELNTTIYEMNHKQWGTYDMWYI